jgi:hypothetical protein
MLYGLTAHTYKSDWATLTLRIGHKTGIESIVAISATANMLRSNNHIALNPFIREIETYHQGTLNLSPRGVIGLLPHI